MDIRNDDLAISESPQVVTFLNCSGGMGRSTAILNVAYALANQGRNVLVLDMDLEAPGLSRFLTRNGEIHHTARYDVLDLIAWAKSASFLTEPPQQEELPDVSDFVVSVPPNKIGSEPELGGLGRLDVIPADEVRDYESRMIGLDIDRLDRTKQTRIGGLLRAWLKGRTFTASAPEYYGIPNQPHHYDFILVNSCAGVTSIGGLCLGPLSDNFVVLTALDDQNINGAKTLLSELGILDNCADDGRDSKPTLILASSVPTGKVDPGKERLTCLFEAVDLIIVKLSCHAQLALFESIFVRDYQGEYLTTEFLQIVELISEFGIDTEFPFSAGELFSLSKDHQRDLIRPLLVSMNRFQFAQLADLCELFVAAVQDDENDQLDSDFASLDRWYRSAVRFDIQNANYFLLSRAWLLIKWGEVTSDSHLERLRIDAAHSAFASLTELPQLTKDEASSCFLAWGNALLRLAEQKSGEEADSLFEHAGEKFDAALRIKSDNFVALSIWGYSICDQAKRKSGEEADRLFKLAFERFQAALQMEPNSYETLNYWCIALHFQANQKSGDEADRLLMLAGEKSAAALRIKPDYYEALHNWGYVLGDQAKQKSGEESDRLFMLAGEKFKAALHFEPDSHGTLNNWGMALADQAEQKLGKEADYLFELAGEKYKAALRIKPDKLEALNNWGCALGGQAKQKSGEEADRLFERAGEKYQAILCINPDYCDAFYNWGNALGDQAKQKSGDEADRLFKLAGEKYAAALRIEPDKHAALNNWGSALGDQAKQKSGKEADRLFKLAGKKCEAAVRIKPDHYEALNTWGNVLADQADQKSGDEADRLYKLAGEKYEAALRIKPDYHEAFNYWGITLGVQAIQKSGKEADRLYRLAVEKYEAALRIKPDYDDALYNWGSLMVSQAMEKSEDEAVRLFKLAAEKYEAALQIKPDYYEAFFNWGNALGGQAKHNSGDEADRLFQLAGEKYEAALRIKPEHEEVFNHWGCALMAQAQQKSGIEANRLFKLAGEKLIESEALSPGSGAYNLACISAIQHQPEECRRWLEVSLKHHTLPPKQHLSSDLDLENVRNLHWFKKFVSKVSS